MSLTRAQAQCLAYLKDFIAREGIAPSIRELVGDLNLNSTNGGHRLLHALEARGHIRIAPKKARAIEIVDHSVRCSKCGHINSASARPLTAEAVGGVFPPARAAGGASSRVRA